MEINLAQRLSKLEATVDSGFERVDDDRLVQRARHEENKETLSQIYTQVQKTNGRVDALEEVNRLREASGKPIGIVRLSDLKFYVMIVIGTASLTAAIILWVMQVSRNGGVVQ